MRIRPIVLVCCVLCGTVWGQDTASVQSKKKAEPKTDAQKYAAALDKFLMDVNKQVEAKISAEKAFYKTTSAIYVTSYRNDVLGNIGVDRPEAALALAAKIAGVNSLDATVILGDNLRSQVQSNVAAMRKTLVDERDMQNSYLTSVAQLDADRAKIATLSSALKALATPNGTAADMKESIDYANQVRDVYVTDQCAEIDAEVKDLTLRQEAAKNAVRADSDHTTKSIDQTKADGSGTRIDTLNKFKKDNCSTPKDTVPAP
jgi:hypothetical protein